MQYNGKEITSQEALDLLDQKDRLLSEKDEKIKKFEEAGEAAASDAAKDGDAGAGETAKEGDAAPAADAAKNEEAGAGNAAPEAGAAKSEEAAADEGAEKSEGDQSSDAGEKTMSEKKSSDKKLSDRLQALEEENRNLKVTNRLKEYEDEGIPPVILSEAKKVILADTGAPKIFKFSETKDEKTVETTKSLSECVYSLLDTIKGIELGEATVHDSNGSADLQGSDEDRVKIKKYSDENKCDHITAYKALREKGEVTEIKIL